jgi:hypothetical protein
LRMVSLAGVWLGDVQTLRLLQAPVEPDQPQPVG